MTDSGLGSWPRRRAGMTPDKAALVQDDTITTYAQLNRATARLAHGLRARGVSRGERVAFLGLNSVELVIAMFATAQLGAVFVPLNTRLAPPELSYLIEHSSPRLLLVEDSFGPSPSKLEETVAWTRSDSAAAPVPGWIPCWPTTTHRSMSRSVSTICS